MAAEAKLPIAALLERLDEMRTAHLKSLEQIDDIAAMLQARPTLGKQAQIAIGQFVAAWHARYRVAYVVGNEAQAIAAAKKVIRSIGPLELERRIQRYLASSDPYAVQARHPLMLFLTDVNRYAQDGLTFDAPIGCPHDPPCGSDAECTRRKLRAVAS